MNPLEIIRIIFDRRHVKDPRNWVLLMLLISFCSYHKLVVMPMQSRQDRQGKRIKQIIRAGKLEAKIAALETKEAENERVDH